MNVLLDTHILLWAITNDPKLPKEARRIILDDANTLYCSVASLWEVTIKHMASPDKMHLTGSKLSSLCKMMGYQILPVTENHISALETLQRAADAPRHNDPFDRILISQAKAEGFVFLTHDSLIPYYNEPCVFSV